jgi:hypothetical protein
MSADSSMASAERITLLVRGLRLFAFVVLAAMVFDVPLGRSRPLAPWVMLDASASWGAAGDSAAWTRARATADSLMAAGADSLLLFGDSLRGGPMPSSPTDRRSDLAAVVDLARAAGRPVHIVTDGRLERGERAVDLPEGSRVHLLQDSTLRDAGIATVEAASIVLALDSLDVIVNVRAAGGGAGAGALRVSLGGRVLFEGATPELGPYQEHVAAFRSVVPAAGGARELLVVRSGGDAVPANDTARRTLEVRLQPAAVVVSTAPMRDVTFALGVLRGTRRGATRGFYRYAPGLWRTADGLLPVEESAVRAAIREASLVLLDGDTAYFGAPRAATRGALILLPTVNDAEEWYAAPGAVSPISVGIAALPWDSLPPLTVAARAPTSGIAALAARRAGRTENRTAIVLEDGARRIAVVRANGFWRWRTRGGRPADAFDALWGSLFDWVGAVRRADGEPAVPEQGIDQELVPRAQTVPAGPVGRGAALDLAPRARGAWWLAALAIAALCVEWVMRRRIGWR